MEKITSQDDANQILAAILDAGENKELTDQPEEDGPCGCLPNYHYIADTRTSEDDRVVKRKKYCRMCGRRWTTYELTESEMELLHGARLVVNAIRRSLKQ